MPQEVLRREIQYFLIAKKWFIYKLLVLFHKTEILGESSRAK